MQKKPAPSFMSYVSKPITIKNNGNQHYARMSSSLPINIPVKENKAVKYFKECAKCKQTIESHDLLCVSCCISLGISKGIAEREKETNTSANYWGNSKRQNVHNASNNFSLH